MRVSRTSTRRLYNIAGQAGGAALLFTVNVAPLVAQIGSGLGHAPRRRAALLYGMGRDNAIPSVSSPSWIRGRIPRNNILLVGCPGAGRHVCRKLRAGAELLNFGDLMGFMGVNIAAFVRYYLRGNRKNLLNLYASPGRLRHLRLSLVESQSRGKDCRRSGCTPGSSTATGKPRAFRHQVEFAASG